MSNVIIFDGTTRLDIPVDRVCDAAKSLDCVLILGFDKDGNFDARASSSDNHKMVWLAQQFIHNMMNGDYGDRQN